MPQNEPSESLPTETLPDDRLSSLCKKPKAFLLSLFPLVIETLFVFIDQKREKGSAEVLAFFVGLSEETAPKSRAGLLDPTAGRAVSGRYFPTDEELVAAETG